MNNKKPYLTITSIEKEINSRKNNIAQEEVFALYISQMYTNCMAFIPHESFFLIIDDLSTVE